MAKSKNNRAEEWQPTMTNPLRKVKNEFIVRDRDLEIHQRGKKVLIPKVRSLKVGQKALNGSTQPYLHPTNTISSFSRLLVREASAPFLEKLPEEDQCKFSYPKLRCQH